MVLKQAKVTRFSGADWADQIKTITLIGVGGIGSWTALNLTRIGHPLRIYDGDRVDETNVNGGQMYQRDQIGLSKVTATQHNCRSFGSYTHMNLVSYFYDESCDMTPICITGLDNMMARKLVFERWRGQNVGDPNAILIDGRLLMENMEIITITGDRLDLIEKYEKEFLFSDESVPDLDCTTKQSTFAAMIIAGLITATLCNFLTNRKIGVEIRDVPFHQKLFLPLFKMDVLSIPAPTHIVITPELEAEMTANAALVDDSY